MRTLILTRGLPASGKSSWAKVQLKKEPGRWKRINKDDMRGMFDEGEWNPDNEDFIRHAQDQLIRFALGEGHDVIVDNTHLVPQVLKKLHRLAEGIGDIQVIEKCFNESVETCLQRNESRIGRAKVPEKVIKDMARSAGIDKGRKLEDRVVYYEPRKEFAPVEQDDNLPIAVLCDLDGTLAKIGNRSPYDASECDIKDLPNWPVIKCVLAMHAQGVNIIFMSGRDSQYRDATIRFIEQYVRQPSDEPIAYQLYMRGHGDQRKDAIVKQELFDEHVRDKYNVQFVLDDRNQVVDFWRSIGLTCFQVAPGAF